MLDTHSIARNLSLAGPILAGAVSTRGASQFFAIAEGAQLPKAGTPPDISYHILTHLSSPESGTILPKISAQKNGVPAQPACAQR